MRVLDEQERRDSLNDVLKELSKSQDILKDAKSRKDFFLKLEDIYYKCDDENFRHYYSDIFSTLTLIDGDSEIGSLEILAQNMQTIKDGYTIENVDNNGNKIDIRKEIIKLYDHTNLDIARINYTKTMSNETMSELVKTKLFSKELEKKVKASEEWVRKSQKRTINHIEIMSNDIKKNQKDMQKEYISILGIFASIVLVFTGGMTFSSSVIENIHKASIYRVTIIALIVGFVFINIIWLLMDFIKTITGRTARRWSWLISVNVVILVLFILSIIACQFDFFKNENMITFEHYSEETTNAVTNSSK